MTQQWVVSVFTVAGAFFLCGFGGAAIAGFFNIWAEPVAGFFAAFGVVSMAYISAPSNSRRFSLAIFVIGSICAWYMLKSSWWPESYEGKAYLPTYLPFIITVVGGLAPLGIIYYPSKLNNERPNK